MDAKKIILLVEDNLQDELLTVRALKKNGVRSEIVTCRDGAEALDWLFARGPYQNRNQELIPTVILLDLQLPKLSGHEVLAAVRSAPQTKMLPVVILTTSKEESDIASSYQNGANSYVQKPVNFAKFTEAIRALGVYWLLVNEPPCPSPTLRSVDT